MLRRRTALAGAAATAGATLLGCAGAKDKTERMDPESSPAPVPDAADDPLDAALAQLHATDPEFDNGLSNHGPMAAEALEALGVSERIGAFIDGYATRLEPMPAADPLPGGWQSALGQPKARAALIRTMEEQLRNEDPAEVVPRIVFQLVPGLAAAAFHGLLRAAHGHRAWTRRSSPMRRTELAHALGYWASRYHRLPGEPGRRATRGLGPLDALAEVPVVDPARRIQGGLIVDRFAVLADDPGFHRAVEAFDPDARTPDEALDELVLASARLYLASSGSPRFVYLHGVTGSAALRLLLPLLPESARKVAVAHQFVAVAAVHATHGEPGAPLHRTVVAPGVPTQVIVAKTAGSDDDHTIKLVEAALREHRRSGHGELLAAAAQRVGLG